MKNLFVHMALPCILLSALAALNSCKKETQLTERIQQNVNDSALLATSAPTVSYMVSTVARSQELPDPISICSASDGSVYAVNPFDNPGIIKLGANGGFTKYFDFDGIRCIKAGANGSLYFVKNYVINNTVLLDSFNVFKVDRNKKVTLIPHSETLFDVRDIAIGPDSSLYLCETDNNRIIKLTKDGVQSVFAGKKGVRGFADGPRDKAHLTGPSSLKFGEDGNLWVLDGAIYDLGQRIRKISMDGTVTTLFTLKYDFKTNNQIMAFAVTKRDKNFNLTANENFFFIVTSFLGETRLRHNQLFHLSNTKVLTQMGANLPEGTNADPFEHDGSLQVATFFYPNAMTVNPKGTFVADFNGNSIRKIARQ